MQLVIFNSTSFELLSQQIIKYRKPEHQMHLSLSWTILIQIFRPLRAIDFVGIAEKTYRHTSISLLFINIDNKRVFIENK